MELSKRLLHEAHVVTVPGEAFGTAQHIRLSYAVSHADVDEGLDRMKAFFAKLSSSLQRYHVDNINAAKTAETRQRRIDKAISLFRQGKRQRSGVRSAALQSSLSRPLSGSTVTLRP